MSTDALRARLEKAKAAAAQQIMSDADEEEAKLRAEIRAAEEELFEKQSTARALQLEQRLEAARMKYPSDVLGTLDLITQKAPHAGSYVIRAPNRQGLALFQNELGKANADSMASHRQMASKCVVDVDGEPRTEAGDWGANLHKLWDVYTFVPFAICNAARELGGGAEAARKS